MRTVVPVVLSAVPGAFLGLVIIGDGESFKLVELKGAGAIIRNETWGNICELKALTNKESRYAKASGHLVDAQPGFNQIAKGNELVGGMHRNPDRVLSKA